MEESQELTMSFDPNTIQHLGIKMYSTLPAAIAELVANSYDADATSVKIRLCDDCADKYILIEDNGCGMTIEDINTCFLRIGRNRRTESQRQTAKGRIATGKKGLGKLALFGIGESILVTTHKAAEDQEIEFLLNWNEILSCRDSSYHPKLSFRNASRLNEGYTRIEIKKLKRKTDFFAKELSVSLSKMFNFPDADFNVVLQHNEDSPISIESKLKFEGVREQFHWDFSIDFNEFLAASSYAKKNELRGRIITSEKPLMPNLRGISLFAHGRLVNTPEFFGAPTSSHFFAYATGWLDVDFVDEDKNIGDEDLISTNRQSLNWERAETEELRIFLREMLAFVQKEWRSRRTDANRKPKGNGAKIDRQKWLKTIPGDKAISIENSIDKMADPDSEEEPVTILEEALHAIAPEYAELHCRYLNGQITDSKVVERLYQQKNYFQAAAEAVKAYISYVKLISGIKGQTDTPRMNHAFGRDEPGKSHPISLTSRSDDIENDIEEGQRLYSTGLTTGFKNPVVSHGTEEDMKARGLFCEKDCLDILSLLSHLFNRLEKRIAPPREKENE